MAPCLVPWGKTENNIQVIDPQLADIVRFPHPFTGHVIRGVPDIAALVSTSVDHMSYVSSKQRFDLSVCWDFDGYMRGFEVRFEVVPL